MADPEDDALTSDERAAGKAAAEQQQAVAAAILSALMLLRPQVTTVTYWIPVTWDEFRQAAGAAIDPAFNAFDKAARAVWMGYDSLDAATLEMQRRYRESVTGEMTEATRRGVEKAIEWGRMHGVTGAAMDDVLSRIVGLNGNQMGPILDKWLEARGAGMAADKLDRMLRDVADLARKDRAGNLAGDVLWDAVQHGRMAGGAQEQRATNAAVVKTWMTAADDFVCGVCGPLHRVSRPINEAFPGGLMAPKAHAECRCRIRIEVAEEGAF